MEDLLKNLIERLKSQIDESNRMGYCKHGTNWGNKKGVLISVAQATYIVDALEKNRPVEIGEIKKMYDELKSVFNIPKI